MADAPADDPVTVFDQDTGLKHYDGFVVITFASCFSTFGITLKIRNDGPLKEAKQAFGRCAQWDSGGLRYLYKGRMVEDEDTSEKLSMNDDDIVQVLAEAKFAGSCSIARKAELSTESTELLSVVNTSNSVIIIVEDSKGLRHRYRVKPTTRLGKVFDDFLGRSGAPRLKFYFDGHRILPNATPENILRDDGTLEDPLLPGEEFDELKIDAHYEQDGGGGPN